MKKGVKNYVNAVLSSEVNSFFWEELYFPRYTQLTMFSFVLYFQILDTAVIRLVGQLAHLHEAHYPETLREAVLLGASAASSGLGISAASLCHMAISLVKPFLAPATRNKLNIVNENNFQSHLLKGMYAGSAVNFRPIKNYQIPETVCKLARKFFG